MSNKLSHFEEGLAAAIAEYVKNYRFFQTEQWFNLTCEFCKNLDRTANVTDLSVQEQGHATMSGSLNNCEHLILIEQLKIFDTVRDRLVRGEISLQSVVSKDPQCGYMVADMKHGSITIELVIPLQVTHPR